MLVYENNHLARYFGIKANRSGHLLAQEAGTNDLVVMDFTGEEVLRNKGSFAMDYGRR